MWNVDAVVSHLLEPRSKRELAFDIPVVGEKVMGEEKPDSGSARKKKKHFDTKCNRLFSACGANLISSHFTSQHTDLQQKGYRPLAKNKAIIVTYNFKLSRISSENWSLFIRKEEFSKKNMWLPVFFFFLIIQSL